MTKELSKKADLALSDLSSDGGLLNEEQNNRFFRKLIEAPTLLREVRTVPMSGPTREINKIGFGSRILRAATQTGGANDDGSNDRYLAESDRAKPTTSKVNLSTKEFIAEVRLPYEVIEDNIEGGNLGTDMNAGTGGLVDTLLDLIAERASTDFEELLIQGDTGSGDTYLAQLDGVLKLLTSNVVDASNAPISASLFNKMLKALPKQYRRNTNALRFYLPMDQEADYRLVVSSRGSDLGDAILTGRAPLPVFGVPLRGAALMPDTNVVFTDPQNIIWGLQRNVRIETDRDIRSREVVVVLTARSAIAIEEEEAAVKLTNLGSASA